MDVEESTTVNLVRFLGPKKLQDILFFVPRPGSGSTLVIL